MLLPGVPGCGSFITTELKLTTSWNLFLAQSVLNRGKTCDRFRASGIFSVLISSMGQGNQECILQYPPVLLSVTSYNRKLIQCSYVVNIYEDPRRLAARLS